MSGLYFILCLIMGVFVSYFIGNIINASEAERVLLGMGGIWFMVAIHYGIREKQGEKQ